MPVSLTFNTATSRFHRDKTTQEEPQVICLAWWRSDQPEPVCRLIKSAPGLTIDRATLPYHGIVLSDLDRDGVDAKGVITEMEAAASGVDAIVTFNEAFHWRSLFRMMGVPDANKPAIAVDAMALATPILALPLMRPGGGLKSPSLREACRFFDIAEPATAEADPVEIALSTVRAVRAVYETCIAAAPKE